MRAAGHDQLLERDAEVAVVRELVAAGVIVIACGGGGIPVVAGEAGSLLGVEAVVDKDLASSLLATAVGASVFAILTEVEKVCLDFGKPTERPLEEVDVAELKRHARAGHFPAGSMGPKVEAVIRFLERGGDRAIITTPEHLADALLGHAGTHIVPNLEVGRPAAS